MLIRRWKTSVSVAIKSIILCWKSEQKQTGYFIEQSS